MILLHNKFFEKILFQKNIFGSADNNAEPVMFSMHKKRPPKRTDSFFYTVNGKKQYCFLKVVKVSYFMEFTYIVFLYRYSG